ncbi:MAG: TAXI family TRAP transporter solute-binding subunit [Proteobacteria bacterium]|nr:TAXI family TRAP transporter solute-binding subunit [Pseudomonadota bacterium]
MKVRARDVVSAIVGAALAAALALPAAAQSKYLTIGTAGSGGAWYPIGGAMAKVIGDNIKTIQPRVEATKGGYENVELLAKGDIDIALVPPFALSDAFKAKGDYAGKPGYPLKVGGWFGCCDNILTIMVPKDSPIRSVMDFKGKRVVMGNPGSTNRYIMYKVIEALGISPGDFQPLDISIAPAVNRLKNRQIDVLWWNATTPHGALVDASVSLDLRVLPLEKPLADKIVNTYDWMDHTVLPAGTYKGMDKDAPTVVSAIALVIHQHVDLETAYRLTKAVFENLDELRQIHAAYKPISLASALNGVNIPLHPGVARYYREKGVARLVDHEKRFGKL